MICFTDSIFNRLFVYRLYILCFFQIIMDVKKRFRLQDQSSSKLRFILVGFGAETGAWTAGAAATAPAGQQWGRVVYDGW